MGGESQKNRHKIAEVRAVSVQKATKQVAAGKKKSTNERKICINMPVG
jgi:hypothetical protein